MKSLQLKNLHFMKQILLTITFLSLINAVQGQSLNSAKMDQEILKIESKVIEWRHDLHQNPELGNREFRTSEIIAKHLTSLGIDVKTEVAKTGVVGVLKGGKPGPVIALRADMDGLPVTERVNIPYASKAKSTYNGVETGVMHACGHDTHVAILMGVAEILAKNKKDLAGTVKFLFQPAEEGPPAGEEGGAELMVKEGALKNPDVDVVFGLHISAQLKVGKITYRPKGAMAAVSDLKITVKGKSSHGAAPYTSVDPIVTSAQIINSLQTILSRNVNVTENAAVVTIGSIHGGNRSNIIPEEVEMLGTVRTLSDKDTELVYRRIREITTHTAEAMGADAVIELPYSMTYPVTYNDPELTAQMLPSLENAAGKSNVILVPAKTGAEDFSFFAKEVPGLFFNIGGAPKGVKIEDTAPHHTPDFYVDDEGLKTGIKAFLNLVNDYAALSKK